MTDPSSTERGPLRLGAMYRRHRPPEELIATARFVEAAGFDELWVVEDCFWAGGMSAAAAALTATERLVVGFGIAPAVARNVAVAAMDVAGIARMFPDRFVAGFGHGVAPWMRQIGAFPDSQLAALEETIDVVRRLLAGERVSVHGRHLDLDAVQLVFPPSAPVPVLLGATGPKSLDVAARVADGLMLPEGSSSAFVRAALARAGRPRHCAVYVLFAIDDDARVAHAAVATAIEEFAAGGIDRRLALVDPGGDRPPVPNSPADRAKVFAVAGTADDCVASITDLHHAGATSVILVPQHSDDEQLARAATEILPRLRG